LEVLRPDLAREIDEGRGTGRYLRQKGWILQSRIARARLRGDTAAVEKALSSFWKGDTADFFYSLYRDRFEQWFLTIHQPLIGALEREVRCAGLTDLFEIGCGDGRALEHCLRRMPQLRRLIGIDINESIVNRNRRTFADEPRLSFLAGNATELLPPQLADGTVVLSYGGVMEYLREAEVARLYASLAACKRVAAAHVEPLDPLHDLSAEPGSRVFGVENSFSHNYPRLMRENGLVPIYAEDFMHDGLRWLMLLGVSPDLAAERDADAH
jgi:SAM-dependent methyltransferase